MSLLTLFGMSLAGMLIVYFLQDKPYDNFFYEGKPVFIQVMMGIFYGSLTALLAILLVNNKSFIGIKDFFAMLIADINPTLGHIIFYSFCAGVGEEILFRAGLQPLIGIWPAAFIFVLLHGYLNPSNFSMSVYGFFLVVISAGFGYLFKIFGIYSAITAHFVYDVAMFCVLKYSTRNTST
jgi:membrane protease YdiL (CAAX protease family)